MNLVFDHSVGTDGGDGALSVSALNQYVKTVLERDDVLSALTVRGEISNFSPSSAGHLYFSLKDEGGLVRCVMFRGRASTLRFPLRNGMKVVVTGSATLYPKDGNFQLYIGSVREDGVGNLWLAFEQLKAKLAAEGLFDPARKRPLPPYPKKIGIVTSPTGAAVHDMIRILGRRFPPAEILVYPARVQGVEAPAELTAGVEWFNRNTDCDLLIVGRGGGSFEDLFAFNDETLARTVSASRIPVVSAVGHETDFTICDFVADLRAPTPSGAAELSTPDMQDLLSRLTGVREKMGKRLTARIRDRQNDLASLMNRPFFLRPALLWEDKKNAVAFLSERALHAETAICGRGREQFSATASKLTALNPLAVLSRGYAAVSDEGGAVVSSVHGAEVGASVVMTLRDGSLSATVTGKTEGRPDGKPAPKTKKTHSEENRKTNG